MQDKVAIFYVAKPLQGLLIFRLHHNKNVKGLIWTLSL